MTDQMQNIDPESHPQNYGTCQENKNPQNESLEIEEDIRINKSLRLNFIKKVYGILCVQLAITAIMCILSMTISSFATFQREHYWIQIVLAIFSIAILLVLFCSRDLSKRVPVNYALLFTFTLFESYSVSACCAMYDRQTVLLAALFTLGITIGLTVYAFNTKTDFTVLTGILFVCLIGLVLFGIACIFIRSRVVNIIYCALGAIVFGIYIVCDTQILIGGKSREIGMDEYVFGAVSLYLDIINLFLYILSLLGDRN